MSAPYPTAPPPSYDLVNQGYSNSQFDQGGGEGYDPYKSTAGNQGAVYPPPPRAAFAQPNYNTPYSNYGQSHPMTEHAVESADSESAFNTASFSDKAVRRAFIKKVYLILLAQLLVTIGFVCLFMFVHPLKKWIQGDGSWFYFVSYGTFLVTYIVLICVPSVRRNTPGNYICLGVFTVAFSYMTGTIASFHSTNIVLIAAGVTALVCLSISLFAIQTKIDFTLCYGLLFALVMVLFFFGLACIIVYVTIGYNRILDCVWGGLAALVFALFLVYDTQMIMGGRKIELSPEEYIYGALQLYIDVVYLFIIILGLFGKSN